MKRVSGCVTTSYIPFETPLFAKRNLDGGWFDKTKIILPFKEKP